MDSENKRDSGEPGGGAGRRDDVRGNPIYPGSGPWPKGDATVLQPGQLGGGDYEESGESELQPAERREGEKD